MRFGLPEPAVDKICAVFALHPQVEQAVIYGSRANGTSNNASDVELTIHGAELSQQTLLALQTELDDLLLPWRIDLSIFDTLDDPALRAQIERDGVVFYQKASLTPDR